MTATLAGGPRRALPLAVTAAVHLLLAALWMASSTKRPASGGPQPASRLLWITPAAPKPPPAAPPKERRPAQPAPRPAVAAPPVAPASPLPADPAPEPIAQVPARPGAAELLANARQAAGAVDRELRANKQAPLQGTGAWGRFESKLAAAKVNHARGVSTETYVAPDGTVTYRTRNGDRVYCRRSGGVAPGLERTHGELLASGGAIGGLTTAGSVRCPSQDPGFRP